MRKKQADTDFLISSLPKNRKEQFFDLMKHRFGNLFSIGLFSLIFAIPFFLVFSFKYAYAYQAFVSFGTDIDKYNAFLNTNTIVFDAIYIIAFLILGIGYSGLSRIVRQMVWGEGIFFARDFFLGVKQNGLRFAVLFVIAGIVNLICDFLRISISNVIVAYIPFAIGILLIPVFLMSLSMSSIYQTKFLPSVVNSFSAFFKKPVKCLLFTLIPLLMSLLTLINNPAILGSIYLAIFVLVVPIIYLAWFLLSLSIFDEYYNKSFYPSFYLKGLRGEYDEQ